MIGDFYVDNKYQVPEKEISLSFPKCAPKDDKGEIGTACRWERGKKGYIWYNASIKKFHFDFKLLNVIKRPSRL